MHNLSQSEIDKLSGGYWKVVWGTLTAAATYALGEDFGEVWKEGWNDPYGID